MDLIHFIRDNSQDITECMCDSKVFQRIVASVYRGYYSRTHDCDSYNKKEICPWISKRYEATSWFSIAMKNYKAYYSEREMGYWTENVEQFKARHTPTRVILSEVAFLEATE